MVFKGAYLVVGGVLDPEINFGLVVHSRNIFSGGGKSNDCLMLTTWLRFMLLVKPTSS